MDIPVEDIEQQAPATLFLTGATGFVGAGIMRAIGRTSGIPQGPFAETTVRSLVRKRREPPVDVEEVVGDVTDPSSLTNILDGVDTVIHLVGIIEEHGEATFDDVIRRGTENMLAEANRAGVRHFIFMSALGAQDNSNYPYHQAKYRAEEAVRASGLTYTIIRPSIIFGKGDGFVSVLAGLVRSFPIVPVVGSGSTMFQPVQVDDVGAAFAHCALDPRGAANQTYELGGAKRYTYEQILDHIARELGKRKPKLHVPLALMKSVVRLSSPLPKSLRPPVTMEQLKMLAIDNSTSESATEMLIGHAPVALEDGLGYIRAI